ncbi:hypothetical protein A2863_01470 [Candidatus Woesebacteria bacterium RIFCSPHIGHO2_01_FULL_38_9b]|uniref:PIN domain-containing protein n=1 Tax=Candidatus Woesebacteria bacterium RIFCSPHIGHO2_01_FULL_38_9b TaxID=1802493 RepID=A0A1F7XZK6_9BACT|nr:MAG: hypothetical protein A2863_01470 [Candidatus Woesebacteria bacterium RIFCSPHIGHO2_01_FULL_38_9b]
MVVNIDFSENFVVDASFVLSYLLPDEDNDYVKRVFLDYQNRKINFFSVSLLPYEVVNGIKSAVIQKRMDASKAKSLLKEFLKLDFALKKIDEKAVLGLALEKNTTTYDASYLWLAKSKKLPFLTLDEKLRKLSK